MHNKTEYINKINARIDTLQAAIDRLPTGCRPSGEGQYERERWWGQIERLQQDIADIEAGGWIDGGYGDGEL